ncbi:hypothetical protein [Hominifimenecus sp. rT4P-3]|uniref:hypothetical protein n=1 Tax=Hominifimenecus sp. rT4P-3 TaxID=3242979 RepID=UPI003DA2CFF1
MYELGQNLSVLALAMAVNILLGTYYQVGRKKRRFSKTLFLSGLIKAVIVGFSFVSLGYCFETTDLSALGITPSMIMNASILLYVGKDVTALAKALGVEELLGKEPK